MPSSSGGASWPVTARDMLDRSVSGDGLPARSGNAPAAALMATGWPPALALRARAASACPGVRITVTMSESKTPASDAPPRDVRFSALGPAIETSCRRTLCMSMYSSNASVTVPAARFRTGSTPAPARPGGVVSGSSVADRPRAAAIGLPARSSAKPRAISSDAAASAPPAAPPASWRAALWSPVSDTVTSFSVADTGAPARSTRAAAGGGCPAVAGGTTATTRAAGATTADSACTCSSNMTDSVPAPRSSLADAGAGPVSSGTTRARPPPMPSYRLPDRSSIAAVLPTIVMFEAAAVAASAF